MKDLVEVIAKALVDDPDSVVVTEREERKTTVLEVRVADSDMGKVIGKQGRIARFERLRKATLDTGRERLELEIEKVRFSKQFVIVKFKGLDDINQVERYKRYPLLVRREDAVPLEEDEYYIADMIGIRVETEDGEAFGTLKDVIETGANDVYVVETSSHGEVLIPAIKECILEVDIEAGRMVVHLLDGLL